MMKDFALFCWSGVIGLLGWFFGGMDGALSLLITLAITDYFSGLAVGWFEHNLSSSAGFKGIARKCFMFALVGIANLIDNSIQGMDISMKTIVCLFYISNEGISILENTHKLGIPIPKILTEHFSNMHKGK
ncbi:MAG: phage holin family protein [Synergistaceae bacterium]|nr:phage holin family protein [Synergistaceae bacterium]